MSSFMVIGVVGPQGSGRAEVASKLSELEKRLKAEMMDERLKGTERF